MTYDKYYWTQSGQNRFRLNEITIWAVNKLINNNAHVSGTKAFLKGRQDMLLYDINKTTWRIASTRFRKAVDRWIINNATKEQKICV
jgi:hypothetical protein